MTQHFNDQANQGQQPETASGHKVDGPPAENRSIKFSSDASFKNSASTPMTTGKMGKMMAIRVQMLDDSITLFQVQMKAAGRILFDQVCKQLNLLEVDYFGLEYQDSHGISYWLDVEKPITHQVCLNRNSEPLLRFCVKFYTPDLTNIEEEYTRYLFSLQIKRDLATGQLQCNDNTAALLSSYIVQAECGDYVVEDYPDHTYLSTYKFVPHQDADIEVKIMENHKKHIGISPGEADLNLLETARRCELYGMKMHPAKDHEGVSLNLAVAHMGVVVFQNLTKINTFSWAKIRKLSFKRKKYLIKLHPEGYGYYKDTVEFYFEDRNHCKNFWKKCVEHHSFFRCHATACREREKHKLLSKGSSFRYSGKTQKQMQEFVRENFVKRQSFQRQSRQNPSVGGGLICTSVSNVGQSISAQPLLPIEESPSPNAAMKYPRNNRLMSSETHRRTSVREDQFGQPSVNYFSHHSLPHQSSQFRCGKNTPMTTFQSAQSTPRNRQLQGDALLSRTTPSSPFHGVRAQPQFANNEDDDIEEQEGVPRQGYRHSIHGGDVFSTTLLEGSLTAGGNNASEITVIENRSNLRIGGQKGGSSLNQSRTSLNSGSSVRPGETGYQIVVQGISGPVAHDVHSDPEIEGDDDDCQMSSEDNLSHDSYELIEWEGEQLPGSKENLKMAPTIPQIIPAADQSQPPVCSQAFSRMKSNDSFSQESDHNVSIMNLNKLSRINHLLIENSSITNPTPSFTSDTDDFQGHEVTLQRPPQTPEERLIVDIVRKRGLQMQMKPFNQASGSHLTNNGTRSLPRFVSGRDHDLVLGPPPTAYPFGRKHVYNYTSRTLPNRQRREKSPVYHARGGLLGQGGHCSSGSSSSQASPKISRPKSLEFANIANAQPTNKNSYFYQDNRPQQLLEYDDSSISGACGGEQPLQYATSSSDVPQTPENPNLPLLPIDRGSMYPRIYPEERIYDVPEGIEPADVTSPSSSSGITDSFPHPHLNLAYNHFRRQEPPPLPKEAPPPLPMYTHNFNVPLLTQVTLECSDPEPYSARPLNHSRVKIQEPVEQKMLCQPKPMHKLFSMSSTESESALSARSAPTPVLGALDDKIPPTVDEIMSKPFTLFETSSNHNDDSDIQPISVNLISPPEESESSTAVLDSEARIPAPPPEFSGAAVISDADMQEATDVEDEEGNDNEEEGSISSQKQVADHEETFTVSQESKLTVIAIHTEHVESTKIFESETYHDENKCSKFQQNPDLIEEESLENEDNELAENKHLAKPEDDFREVNDIEEEDEEDEEDFRAIDASENTSIEKSVSLKQESDVIPKESKNYITDIKPEETSEDLQIEPEIEDEISQSNDVEYCPEDLEEEQIIKEEDLHSNKETIIDQQITIAKTKTLSTLKCETSLQDPEIKLKITTTSPEEEKSPSNGEDESEVIKIGEMYVRLDTGSTLSDNGSDDDDAPALDQPELEANDDGVIKVTMPTIQHPEKVYIPSPSTDISSDPLSAPETEETSTGLARLPSLPTGDSASSLGLDQIPPPPPIHDDTQTYADEDSFTPPPQESPPPDLTLVEVTPKVAILPSPPIPEVAQTYFVPLPIRALSRISERSNSEGVAQLEHQSSPPGSRSVSPPSEASKGPAEDTMSDKNYTSSEDNDNPPSLCSDLPENGISQSKVATQPQFSVEIEADINFPSPPSSLIEGSTTIHECKTEVTHIEPDSLFLELSPPGDGEEEDDIIARRLSGGDSNGSPYKKRREKIPYHFSISSENEVTNKEDDDSQNSLHESMEILEEVATEDHFDHDVTTDTDDDADCMARDIFEMPPLATALEERGALVQSQNQSSEPFDFAMLPPLGNGGNEYIV